MQGRRGRGIMTLEKVLAHQTYNHQHFFIHASQVAIVKRDKPFGLEGMCKPSRRSRSVTQCESELAREFK